MGLKFKFEILAIDQLLDCVQASQGKFLMKKIKFKILPRNENK